MGLLSPCSSPLPGGDGDGEDGDVDVGGNDPVNSVSGASLPLPRPTPSAGLPTAPLFLHMAFRTVVEGKGEHQSASRKILEKKSENCTLQGDNTLPLCLST